jgi:hypothetical protein
LKHRIHAAIDRYGLQATGISDLLNAHLDPSFIST